MRNAATHAHVRLADSGADTRHVLITGGAGFIGTNLAHRLMSDGIPVTIYDNLSRAGVEQNVQWLRRTHGSLLRVEVEDVRNRAALQRAVRNARQVVHLAAQVAVTTSLTDPLHDFDVNALGTLNLLTVLRGLDDPPPLLFTSTNKVYGGLDDVALQCDTRRYSPIDERIRSRGIGESRALDFHSPYGCSKGAADQYVIDYARTFGLRTVVFRMSCIYGPHQFGTEDQGWVAHFLIRALRREPITLYGDGRQVRDVLFVEDLVDAMERAFANIDVVSGRAFNMGGGAANTTSLLELLELIGEITGRRPDVTHDEWRPGDQRYYVSDTSLFSALTGWRAKHGLEQGVQRLHDWLVEEDVPARLAARTFAPWADEAATAAAART